MATKGGGEPARASSLRHLGIKRNALANEEKRNTNRELGPEGGAGEQEGKTMRRLTATVTSLVLLLGVANYAAAKGGVPAGAGGCAKKINLVASPAGKAIAARGTAAVRTAAKIGFVQQNFEVSMRAAVADGTTFMVFANGLPAGTITIVLGNGVLSLDNEPPNVLPAGVDPVCSIGPVVVTDAAGNTILSGSF